MLKNKDRRNFRSNLRITPKALRIGLGKTQAEIATALGITQQAIAKLEKGDMKLSTLSRFATALGGEVNIEIVIDGRCYKIYCE